MDWITDLFDFEPIRSITAQVLYAVFFLFGKIGVGFSGVDFLDSTALPGVHQIAIAIKPIAYLLLAVFALVEFTHLAERMGNINGFMGTSLVIEVLIKILLAKLVVDNSTEICTFIMNVIDAISSNVANVPDSQIVTYQQVDDCLNRIWPNWFDLVGQLSMFSIIIIFGILSLIITTIAYVIFVARVLQIYVYTAISPIPLATALSKEFNVAPNFLKNYFAVGLQGVLIIIMLKFYSIIVTREIQNIINPIGDMDGTLGFILKIMPQGTGSLGNTALLHLIVAMLFCSVLLLITVFQTEKWAKSICHAI